MTQAAKRRVVEKAPDGKKDKDSRAETGPSGNDRGEVGGRDGPEPTRYGDWEVNGRCTDF